MQTTEILYSRGYRLGPRIGKGSYARVKVVERLSDNKIMAVKIVSRRRATKEFLYKFLPRELSVILTLSHRNIIQVYEIVQTEELVCIMMEYASRGDLLDYIKKHGVLKEEKASLLFSQVCEGIDYLHSRNICHRDLKCENILLRRNMTVALSDFGFSRKLPALTTLSNTYCGSTAYASPELLRGTPYKPLQNDIWSLGCIIFIMVTGQMPFSDKNAKKMMYRQLKGKVNFPENRTISATCKSLIACTLEPNTNLRYDIKAVLFHPWLQPFLLDKSFINNTLKTQIPNNDTDQSNTDLINFKQEKVNDSFNNVTADAETDKITTKNKDTRDQSPYYNLQSKASSLSKGQQDAGNENSDSLISDNKSLCRMPGKACIFHHIKKQECIQRLKEALLENDKHAQNVFDSCTDARFNSEFSVGINSSNSTLLSSADIENTLLPSFQQYSHKTPYSSNEEMSNETVSTEDKSSDKTFQVRIKQILQIPDSKTTNSRSCQDQQILPSYSWGQCETSKHPPDMKHSSHLTDKEIIQSSSMTRLQNSQTKTIIKQFTQSSNSYNPVVATNKMKNDIALEQSRTYQAGLVTQMRRIFESKNAGTSTNERS